MKKKITMLTTTAVFASGLLVGCAGNQNMNEQPEDVTYEPTRYDNNMNDEYRRDMNDNMDKRDVIDRPDALENDKRDIEDRAKEDMNRAKDDMDRAKNDVERKVRGE
ncbi:hypothetical protein [Halobacillus salinus]|uniref:hypothetical protein n=1 Tax=Halobacillus salinus TaxID=192814 RepID=UPI0009A8BD2F|nr:hypothetical protein [Halobacillus salinus]